MDTFLAQVAVPLAKQGPEQFSMPGGDIPGDPQFANPGVVEPGDQLHFENVMAGAAPNAVSSVEYCTVGANTANPSVGEAILDRLESLKNNGDVMQAEIVKTLGQEELGPADMLHVQYQLMRLNLEIQTTSNMAHHGVEDIKTIMRGQ